MKKYSKFLAIMLVFAMILPGIAQAAPVAGSTQVERVAGAGREETAIAASKVAYPAGATNVVLAGYAGEVDALTGTLLANEMKAPLLLTRAYKLTDATKAEITRLGAKKVYILGGEKVVEPKVVTELEAMNITVERIDGDNRYETAVMAGEKSGAQTKKVFLAKGLGILADALAVGPASAKEDMPVLLTQTDMVPEATMKALKDWGVTHITLVGGTSAISAKVETELKAMNITVDRVEGSDREKTAVAIADKYFAGSKNVIVANGYVYADALVGGYLGALQNAPIVLVDTNVLKASTEAHLKKADMAWILGGVNAVNATTANKVVAAVDDTAMELKVMSVSAINGKEVEIKFNKAVDESTVVTAGTPDTLKNITFTAIGTAPAVTSVNIAAELSEDGKTLSLTATDDGLSTEEYFNGEYAVLVPVAVTDVDANPIEAYSAVVSLKDNVRPTVAVTYPANGKAKFTFSEPVEADNTAIAAAMTITKDEDSSSVTINASDITVAADNKSFELDMRSGAANLEAKKNHTVKLVGLKDFAGNLISPNPTTLTLVNGIVDDVDPKVVGIEVKSDKLFVVKFSEELSGNPTINIDAAPVVGTIAVDTKDKTKYNVTLTTAITGLHTVEVAAGFADKSNNTGAAFSKVVEFKADTIAPKYVSHELKEISGTMYLIVKYDEKVKISTATNAFVGTYLDSDYITQTATVAVGQASVYDAADATATEAEAIKINLSTLTQGTYTVELAKDLVEDLSVNKSAAKDVTFTLGTVGDTTKPTVTSITPSITVEDEVTVVFSEDVTVATALNVNNYLVEGVNVFEKAIFKTNNKTVVLTLKDNAITVKGDRQFTIKNVTDKAGNIMLEDTKTISFEENVKPKLVSAKFTGAKEITTTFSEPITGTAVFEVYVDGVKLDPAASPADFTVGALSGNTIKIATNDNLTLSKTYVVKYISGIVDGATPTNTAVTGTQVTVTN